MKLLYTVLIYNLDTRQSIRKGAGGTTSGKGWVPFAYRRRVVKGKRLGNVVLAAQRGGGGRDVKQALFSRENTSENVWGKEANKNSQY
jgi:hypothetical protein